MMKPDVVRDPNTHRQRESIRRHALLASALLFLAAVGLYLAYAPSGLLLLWYGLTGVVFFAYWHFTEAKPALSFAFGVAFFVMIGALSTEFSTGSFLGRVLLSITVTFFVFFTLVEVVNGVTMSFASGKQSKRP